MGARWTPSLDLELALSAAALLFSIPPPLHLHIFPCLYNPVMDMLIRTLSVIAEFQPSKYKCPKQAVSWSLGARPAAEAVCLLSPPWLHVMPLQWLRVKGQATSHSDVHQPITAFSSSNFLPSSKDRQISYCKPLQLFAWNFKSQFKGKRLKMSIFISNAY